MPCYLERQHSHPPPLALHRICFGQPLSPPKAAVPQLAAHDSVLPRWCVYQAESFALHSLGQAAQLGPNQTQLAKHPVSSATQVEKD